MLRAVLLRLDAEAHVPECTVAELSNSTRRGEPRARASALTEAVCITVLHGSDMNGPNSTQAVFTMAILFASTRVRMSDGFALPGTGTGRRSRTTST